MIAPARTGSGRYHTIRHMDFQLTEQQELIRKEVATLARSFSLDYWLEKDRKAEYPADRIRAPAHAGRVGVIIPDGDNPRLGPGRLAGDDHPGGVRRLGPRRHRSGGHAVRDLRGRRRAHGRLADPLLPLPSDARDQARLRGPQESLSSAPGPRGPH